MWADTFEDWFRPLGVGRQDWLHGFEGEWVISVAEALARQGAEVHILHGTLESEGVEVQRPSGAMAHFIRAPRAYRWLRVGVWQHRHWQHTQRLWPLAPLASTLSPSLLRRVRELRPDVVVIQDYESLRFDLAAALLRAAGLRVMAMDTGGSAAPSGRPWKRRALRLADRLLACHAAEARRAREARGHPDVAVWPLPVRTDIFRPGDRASARRRLGIDEAQRIVVSAGRLHGVKGLGQLTEACATIDCDLVLIGSGAEEARLRARGDPRLRLVGALDAASVRDWFVAADVVALASHREGRPAVVIEAFCCGRTVVATAVGGVPELVRPGRTGWLVPPRNVDALRAAVTEALEDRARADALGEMGRRECGERFSMDNAGRELLRLLTR